ncbi:hypothetical protein R1sor_005891 [Riccia sorocarpa]|uniref:Uncharacterized protein n=1 Tax=Riccia sorocarpa TaxID=122646 RepID=A0ABD3HQ81_9MARC
MAEGISLSLHTRLRFALAIQLEWGVDQAEDGFTGLDKAAELDWQAANCILVHIGDASCHGFNFIITAGVYPGGDKYGRNIATILRRLQTDCRITRYFFWHIEIHTRKMRQESRRVAETGDWLKEWNIDDFSEAPQKIIAACR